MAESAEWFMEDIERYLEQTVGEIPALQRLVGVLSRAVTLIETKLSLLAAIGDACWGDRRGEKFQAPAYQWIHGTIAGLLSEAVTNGEIRALDATFTADPLDAGLG